MKYRRGNRADLDAFVNFRLEFVTLIRDIQNRDQFEQNTRDYLVKHIDREDLVIFLALDKNNIVASAMASITHTVPRPSCPNGISAELLNVYTKAAYRRQGHAEKLLRRLIEEVRLAGVEKIVLDYTELGLPLYEKLGFTPLPHQLQLRIG